MVQARKVLVTVSMEVLKTDTINCLPGLSQKEGKAIAPMAMSFGVH